MALAIARAIARAIPQAGGLRFAKPPGPLRFGFCARAPRLIPPVLGTLPSGDNAQMNRRHPPSAAGRAFELADAPPQALKPAPKAAPSTLQSAKKKPAQPCALDAPSALLGGLSPQQFMKRHWQKKPLLIRAAMPGALQGLEPSALFNLAAQPGVESRLVLGPAGSPGGGWALRHGPFSRRSLPPQSQPGWSLLVQGLDLHWPQAHDLMRAFRFIPEARLDDVMVSYASDQGGVGPHFDSYDVFLLQVRGRRRWRLSRMQQAQLQEGVPLKILKHFEAEESHDLEPGDMLYLPPRWAHDGVALGPHCMTASVGFRAASRGETATQVVQRLLDAFLDDWEDQQALPGEGRRWMDRLYKDPEQPASAHPAHIPDALRGFARQAVERLLNDPAALDRALGEWLSEPKPQAAPEPEEPSLPPQAEPQAVLRQGLRLARRSRMLYDTHHVFINGESFSASGRDATLMRVLADSGQLSPAQCARLSPQALGLLGEWWEMGWISPV
jgi:50S ribosomal protein L16 3-hydroxylase